MLDSWTITIKQNVRLQQRMHLEKNWLDQIQNGRLSAIIHFHIAGFGNRIRWLDHYYKTKCEISGEDASWKILTWSNSKWPHIGHYSLSHGRYLVNRARWLDHYYRMKCEISAEDASLKILNWSNSKWPPLGHCSLSHGRYLVNRAR